ncbi:Pescadillo N-terminus/BRCA1 C Terminus (BRCT) domain containing protein, putative [Leishmania donovani]|uniref:Pescadillo homolog n=1 Tax=Leishmania donovani TaxID=5661 RepID=A0A3S5H5C9_LEIDO|nr:Pescadillo N-terminus/BRCA1 C Terminus (BRCT) domain containing protein, putative [Leishmania donovani]
MAHKKQAWAKRVKKERFKKKFLTRMQATRLLQMESVQFRRLCILKGIYPRALNRSKQKQSGHEKQYYLAREIKWLVRDQIAEKMMAYRAWEKKVKRAEAMGRSEDLKVLQSSRVKPRHSLVATIKERYPYFIDAIRDVDDAMSMIHLYAFLSPEIKSDTTIEIHHSLTSGMSEKAKEVCERWDRYVARARVLTKGFISIKGYYYEAIVKGERVRWLCPHEYAHRFPPGIQQYVMLSFLEFYLEMMKFVLFKLESDLARDEADRLAAEDEEGVTRANAEDFANGGALAVLDVGANGAQAKEVKEAESKRSLMGEELHKVRELFRGLTFFISREVPSKRFALVINACGGRVATDYVPSNITHVVVDRPALPPGMKKHDQLEYVQPQYIFDCLNARLMLPVTGYRIGEELPPHVSPFSVSITNSAEDNAAVEQVKKDHPRIVGYVPARVHEIRKLINPSYSAVDPEGKVAHLEGEYSDEESHVAVPEMDMEDDVSLSGDELAEARRKPAWQEEEVTEEVQRPKLSAFKVKKQREMNLMNAPTNEVVARRRQALRKAQEKSRQTETSEARLQRKMSEVKRQEAATRKMQLQVARKKAARFYKMISGVVQGTAKKAATLEAKAKHIAEGKLHKTEDGKGLVNTRLEARRQRAEAKGKKLKERKAGNPYKKLPKWVQ